MNKKYRTSDNKPSDMFLDSLSGYGIGSDEMTCEWCNRIHLCPDNEYVTRMDIDIEEYRLYCEETKKKNPDGVVLHYDCDAVSGHEMNGIMFVITCPCNGLYRYEHFIWEHKNTIRNYLEARTAQENQWAKEEVILNILAGKK